MAQATFVHLPAPGQRSAQRSALYVYISLYYALAIRSFLYVVDSVSPFIFAVTIQHEDSCVTFGSYVCSSCTKQEYNVRWSVA